MTSTTATDRGAQEYRWLRWPGLALAALGVAMILVSPQLAGHKDFSAYVECKKDTFTPAHFCFARPGPAYAALTDHRRDATRYTVCVTDHNAARKCNLGKTGTADEARYQATTAQSPGLYDVNWYVRGREVERWRFSIYSGPATH
jgi:hypothetical protein